MTSIPRIFISYRREDSSGHTGRLNDRLSTRLDSNLFFMDLKTIGPGVDFVQAIKDAIASCDLLIAIIGKRWLAVDEAKGIRRIDDPSDPVRLEISTALVNNKRVIPVLVQGASMPTEQELPGDLKKLSGLNAVEISDKRWDYDVDLLAGVLRKELKLRGRIQTKGKVAVLLVVVAVMLIISVGVYRFFGPFDTEVALRELAPSSSQTQSSVDAEALNLISRYLSENSTITVSADELKNTFKGVSNSVREMIFLQAEKVRRENWRDLYDKPLMERTIPIFQALIEVDNEIIDHRYYAQLGFALKDQRKPQWKEAERLLSKAIKLRGQWEQSGWIIYEFNRAVCRIMLDDQYLHERPSSASIRQVIIGDLRAVYQGDPEYRYLLSQSPVNEWLSINKVTEKSLE